MDSFEEATQQGLRRGWRNFLASLGTHLGKVVAYAILAVVVVVAAVYLLDYLWDGFTSPFTGAWSWTTGKAGGAWDTVTGWWPGGDEAAAADVAPEPAIIVTETTPEAVPAESSQPGAICSRTSGWNPFCD